LPERGWCPRLNKRIEQPIAPASICSCARRCRAARS
jgi:hypothetical protein